MEERYASADALSASLTPVRSRRASSAWKVRCTLWQALPWPRTSWPSAVMAGPTAGLRSRTTAQAKKVTRTPCFLKLRDRLLIRSLSAGQDRLSPRTSLSISSIAGSAPRISKWFVLPGLLSVSRQVRSGRQPSSSTETLPGTIRSSVLPNPAARAPGHLVTDRREHLRRTPLGVVAGRIAVVAQRRNLGARDARDVRDVWGHRAWTTIRIPGVARTVIAGMYPICWPGTSRRRKRRTIVAKISVSSIIAKPVPMHCRWPPPNGK